MKKFDKDGNEILEEIETEENENSSEEENFDVDLATLSQEELLEKTKDLISKVKSVSAEAKKHRKGKAEYRTLLDQFEAEAKQRKEAELKEQGKTDELLTEAQKERDAYKGKAEQYDLYVQSKQEEAKELLGDSYLPEFDNLSLSSLSKVVKTLSAKKNENIETDDGVSKVKKKIVLSDDEKKKALEMFPGVEPEKAYEYFNEIQANRKKKE